MTGPKRKNWRDLCSAALAARDADELLEIAAELNQAFKHEEQVRHDFRMAAGLNQATRAAASGKGEAQ